MNTMAEWIDLLCRELAIDRAEVDTDLVLELTRDVAHGVARPAAPLSAFLVGLAVGREAVGREAVGGQPPPPKEPDPDEGSRAIRLATERTVRRVSALAQGWGEANPG